MTAHGLGAPPVSADFVGVIRELRKDRRVSAVALAARVTALGYPMSRSTISNMERGDRPTVALDYAVLACEALGTSLAEVLAQTPRGRKHGVRP